MAFSTMAEHAVQKAWPFHKDKDKDKDEDKNRAKTKDTPTRSGRSLFPGVPFVRVKLASDVSSLDAKPKRRSKSDVPGGSRPELHITGTIVASGVPEKQMQSGTTSSITSRQRAHTERERRPPTVAAMLDLGEISRQPARAVTEHEYLIAPPPSAQTLSREDHVQMQLGREDAWLLMLGRHRQQMEAPLSQALGTVFFDLEQYFFPVSSSPAKDDGAPHLSIRDEAMLEEARRMVTATKEQVEWIARTAEEVEAARARRKTL